ncbi:class I SAM-dependent methyltransferase [Pseudogemmobacter humi]|uniref:Methyltransferase domain-containing protein n=1 Tax=Pseudogemmobacter humi TaxID=2483812 RepID=A0A3P5XFC1_9RHOB|nr:class I SAM-dependent methyltransferase [Pseudogemmobacter humi]VDC33440.1 hypothetical protein XINFAN_03834 [Pseudogemmobacter humi]
MSPEASNYIRSVAYPDYFHREQSPVWTATVMAALGHSTPGRRGTRWCELGCGQGFSATLFAAVNPNMQFHGIDINPDHIRVARERAHRAGLSNVTFECADLREVEERTGVYDFISCFGVLSWVGQDVRQSVIDFIGRNLAPGGVATLHYMSDPGGAVLRAFHSVFRALSDRQDPVGEGFKLLSSMRDAKAGFFQLYPVASEALDALMRERPAYVAHEYLNPDFLPLPFGEVCQSMNASGLEWRGSANPLENIDAFSIPGGAADAITEIPEGVLRETMKDLARNQTRRVDIFTRKRNDVASVKHIGLLDGFIWGLIPGTDLPADGVFASSIGPVEFDVRILSALVSILRRRPARFSEMLRSEPFPGRAALLNQCLQVLLTAGIAHPVFPGFDSDAARKLNSILRAAAAAGHDVPGLAAPALASGIGFDTVALNMLYSGRGLTQKALLALLPA